MNHVTATRRGGEVKVAAMAGAVLSAPHRWQQEKSSGGAGGLVMAATRMAMPRRLAKFVFGTLASGDFRPRYNLSIFGEGDFQCTKSCSLQP
jgi:hypothetical protein